jgi:hypothetical protein
MSKKRTLMKYVLEQNAAGYYPHVRPNALTSARSEQRRSICTALGWTYQQWYYAACQQKRSPYRYEQADADNGWIDQELVGTPSILFSPRHQNGFTVRVSSKVTEALDYALDELKPARTRVSYARTGTTEPTVVLASLNTEPELREQAQDVDDCAIALERAHARLYRDTKAAKARIMELEKLAGERAELAKERAQFAAEKAALGR